MHRTPSFPACALAALALGTPMPAAHGQEPGGQQPAYIQVYVPEDATLSFDSYKTRQTGTLRRFRSPPLPSGRGFYYVVKATWQEQGKPIVREQEAHVRAGQETTLVFSTEERPGPAAYPQPKPSATTATEQRSRTPDVVFVPTPQEVVDRMLELAGVKKDDVVYDLGCGDGRIVVTAAKKYGCKAIGFDIDPERVKESRANVKKNKVEGLVTIRQADVFTLDLRPASVVTLYLLPQLNVKLMPQLAKLKPGSRIVSHDFDMKGAKPKQEVKVKVDDEEHTIYLWTVPWEKE
jgi:uncharacterized protein (TIGR03000 family)